MPGDSPSYPEDHQRGDYHRSPVVESPLLVARGYPAPLLEPVYAPLDHVAPAVGRAVELWWPTPTALALVLKLGDDVWDAPAPQQPTAGREAIAPVGDEAFRPLAWASVTGAQHAALVGSCRIAALA